MGLDMYLYQVKEIKDISWLTKNEETKESKYDKKVKVTFADGKEKELHAWHINYLYFTDETTSDYVSDITKVTSDSIVIKVWKDNGDVAELVIPKSKIASIKFQFAYWRKANQIHSYFVRKIQHGKDDCGDYAVTGEQLQELVKLCRKVLSKKDENFSSEELPTQEGFFFGSYNYDEYYYADLKETIDQLKGVKKSEIFTYSSSW